MVGLADSWGTFYRVIFPKYVPIFDTNYCKSKGWNGLCLSKSVVRDHLKQVITGLFVGAQPGYSIVRGIWQRFGEQYCILF